MAKKHHQAFTWASIVRLAIFGVIVYLAIVYLSVSSLPQIQTPDSVNQVLGAFTSSDLVQSLSDKINPSLEKIKNLPQAEYQSFKNQLIQEIVNRLEKILK